MSRSSVLLTVEFGDQHPMGETLELAKAYLSDMSQSIPDFLSAEVSLKVGDQLVSLHTITADEALARTPDGGMMKPRRSMLAIETPETTEAEAERRLETVRKLGPQIDMLVKQGATWGDVAKRFNAEGQLNYTGRRFKAVSVQNLHNLWTRQTERDARPSRAKRVEGEQATA